MMNKMMITEENLTKVAGGCGNANSITWAELGDSEAAELLSGSCPDCHNPITVIDSSHRKCNHCGSRFEYRSVFNHAGYDTHMAWCSPL